MGAVLALAGCTGKTPQRPPKIEPAPPIGDLWVAGLSSEGNLDVAGAIVDGKTVEVHPVAVGRSPYGVPTEIRTDVDQQALSPSFRDFAQDAFTAGIAIVGDVGLRLFRSMTSYEQKKLFPIIESQLRDAEARAIAKYAALGAKATEQVEGFSEAVKRSVRIEIKHAVTAQQSDGAQVSYLCRTYFARSISRRSHCQC
jgi:hypothetical protein